MEPELFGSLEVVFVKQEVKDGHWTGEERKRGGHWQ